jgi:hypothetical protein
MATCDDIRPLLGAYADAQLDPLETEAVVVHLEQCGRCRQIVRDQQQVQHVLDSWGPPDVASAEWADMSRRLRAELEGRGDRLVLKTRPRTEFLEPTPSSIPSLTDDEVRSAASAAKSQPAAEPLSGKPAGRRWWSKTEPVVGEPAKAMPTTSVLRVPPQRSKSRTSWVAHAVGLAATILVIVVGVSTQQMSVTQPTKPVIVQPPVPVATVKPVIAPIRLAQSQDVAILDVQTLDPDYNVIIDAGNASDAVTVSVVLGDQG